MKIRINWYTWKSKSWIKLSKYNRLIQNETLPSVNNVQASKETKTYSSSSSSPESLSDDILIKLELSLNFDASITETFSFRPTLDFNDSVFSECFLLLTFSQTEIEEQVNRYSTPHSAILLCKMKQSLTWDINV